MPHGGPQLFLCPSTPPFPILPSLSLYSSSSSLLSPLLCQPICEGYGIRSTWPKLLWYLSDSSLYSSPCRSPCSSPPSAPLTPLPPAGWWAFPLPEHLAAPLMFLGSALGSAKLGTPAGAAGYDEVAASKLGGRGVRLRLNPSWPWTAGTPWVQRGRPAHPQIHWSPNSMYGKGKLLGEEGLGQLTSRVGHADLPWL